MLFPSFGHAALAKFGGADRDRTDDLKLAKLALSQLSYDPTRNSNVGDRVSERNAFVVASGRPTIVSWRTHNP